MLKLCRTCLKYKPPTTEYFQRCRANRDGLKNYCKACASIAATAEYRERKEGIESRG